MTEGRVEGGCLCGAVRYSIGLPPLWVAHCHCSMCRRAQGAGFVTWVGASETCFVLQSGTEALARYQSLALWSPTPHFPRAAFDQLQGAMRSAGIIKGAPSFEACVDEAIVTRALGG